MKIVIVSDTHGSRKNIENVCECNPDADMLIHLGDVEDDADYIEAIFECPTHIVGGNNDFFSRLPREEEFFKTHDFHLHVPEGAVPKDGPSAGVTMTTAIYSAVTGKKVLAKVAMTGEITLRGRVLPIGGLKEKLLAAKQAGIQKVVVPKENKPDVEELEEEITEGMQIVFAGSISDVLKEALVQK